MDLHTAGALVPDALWNLIEPLLPIPSPIPQGGRPRLKDRACLAGIVFVLRSGIRWRMLPKSLRCGSGMTCWATVNNIQPGPTATDMSATHADIVKSLIPLGRMGDVSEVAGFVAYLASKEAGFVTGASLTIDGGYVA